MKATRWALGAMLAFAMSAMALTGSAFGQSASPSGADKDLTFIVGYTQPPTTLNPFKGILTSEYEINSLQYPLLFNFDKDTLVAAGGGLAEELPTPENGGVSDDGMTYTIKIRSGLTWSDGEPITANDVAWTYNTILDKGFTNFSNYLPFTDSIEATDDTTLVWKTKKPTSAPFVPPWIYIVPEHVWSKYETREEINKADVNVDPVVAGPFQVTEFQNKESVTMENVPGPSYLGEPTLDRVIFQFFTNDETMVQSLQQGTIDFAESVPAGLFDTLQNDPSITRNVGAAFSYSQLSFNQCFVQKACSAPSSTSTGPAYMKDPVLRKAVAMAIDKQQLVDRILRGYGEPGTTMVVPSAAYWHWQPDQTIPFDIDGANQMLDDAGYTDTDGDGIRNDPASGDNLQWRFDVPTDNGDRVKATKLIAGWLGQIGIDTSPTPVTVSKITDIWYANDYDIYAWGWGPDPDPDFILSTYTTDQCLVWSDTCWSNPEYDKLYQEQRTAATKEERQADIQQMQQIFYEDVPQIVLWYDNDLQAYRSDRWTGFVPSPKPNAEGRGGSLLFQYTPYSYVNIKPVSAAAGTASSSSGISPILWVAIVAVVVLVAGGLLLARRRRESEEEA
jgi:peptide/nickel transport system substrate-binding protein